MPLQDSDNLIIGRGDTSYKISYSELKDELGTGGGGGALSQTGITITATPPGQVPTQLLAQGGIGLGPSGIIDPPDWSWYKDDVLIPGATSDTLDVTDPGTYKAVATVVDPALPEGENTSTKERSIGPLYGAISMTELLVSTTDDTAPATVTLSRQWTGPTDTTNTSGKPFGGGDDWQVPEYQLLIDDVVETDWSTNIPSYNVLDTITDDVKLTFNKRSLDNASGDYAEATKDQIIKAPVTGPDATMHGLRFDGDRGTYLQNGVNGSGTTFTLSAWIKLTEIQTSNIYNQSNSNSDYLTFDIKNGDSLRLEQYEGSAKVSVTSAVSITKNIWQNVTFVVDTTQAAESDRVKLYLNGSQLAASGTFPTQNLDIASGYTTGLIGQLVGNRDKFNGYLSDVYFVEQALPPETFGKSFEGKWGPLDSDEVKSTITTKSPEFIAAFPDDQYDTSQVWSKYLTIDTGKIINASKGFNGATSDPEYAESSIAEAKFRFTFPQPVSGSITVWSAGSSGNESTISVSTGESTTNGTPGYPATTLSGLTNVEWVDIQRSGAITAFTGIAVNNVVLVDNPASFGANGFYLPFDPAATGVNYTSKCSTTANIVTDYAGLSSMFDGNQNTYGGIYVGTLDITGLDVTGSSITFKVVAANDSAWEIKINGTSIATGTQSQDVVTGAISGGTLTSIQLINTSVDPAFGTNFATISVDGVLLIDHSSIGVDDSGNDNHFHDENFAVGNTDEVWSQYLEVTDRSGVPVSTGLNQPKQNGFDGSMSTRAECGKSNGLKFTFPAGLSGSVELYNRASVAVLSVTGDNGTTDIQPQTWANVGTVAELGASIQIYSSSNGGVDNQESTITRMIVGGVDLIDKNIQDTVLDTPMRNYAVLTSGKNGNLVADLVGQSNTYRGENNVSYYYERDGVGDIHEGGTAFNTTAVDEVINFGQQPFAASNVTYDQAAGTVEIASAYNTSQEWSSIVTTTGAAEDPSKPISNIFDGTDSEGGLTGAGTITLPISTTISKGGVGISVAVNAAAITVNLKKDAATVETYDVASFSGIAYSSTYSGEITAIEITRGTTCECKSIYVNGARLVDSSLWNTSQNWSKNGTVSNISGNITNLFDGNPQTSLSSDGIGDWQLASSISGGVVSVLVNNGTSANKVQLNNESEVSLTSKTGIQWHEIGTVTDLSRLRWQQSGGNYSLRAIAIDDKILVDGGGGTYNTLYQTWEQWARTALGYAVDRIAALEQRNVQLEALVEEARTRLAALELNEVSDDAVDTALITLIGNINDRLTVLEGGN